MNVKKRPRLQLAPAETLVANTNSYGSTSGNGNGLFLTSSVGNVDVNSGAQIFLTICGEGDDDGDENSTESGEYYAIESNSLTTHIKQEPDLDLHALLPTNLQLPTGCEIYLVKDTTISSNPTAPTKACQSGEQILPKHSMTSIKLEPDSMGNHFNVNKLAPSTNVVFVSGSGPCTVSPPSSAVVVSADVPSTSLAASTGFNVKLDAYKKRDDKRRATHNEVERRRRDKINCWIFKLKEMLPVEGNRYKPIGVDADDSSCKTTIRNNAANGRTPPNDSKSQILIKACDYIKSMQNEIDNLRECLKEAESLRLSNQALRDELEAIKQQHELQERFNAAGGSFNITLNSLNSSGSATSDLFEGIEVAPNLSTVSSINFTKRGLLIADYDE
ncbi:uncharacterized protein LOC115629263 [Scaptodrosophila lebanonensis]|uniref:Uncharacterized protein LOC115629263 n=1 Tax=Drosophila lebanonensis TaxID=7225 RepID=A0A6J2U337_DROLE|nr:uncharacterized protein LOC115629263 [Scaptodrosophila lebanonensis]